MEVLSKSTTYERMVILEDKFKNVSVGDEKRFYFNIAIAVVSNYLNSPYCTEAQRIDELLCSSKFYKDVVQVLKFSNNACTQEESVHVVLVRKLNNMEREMRQIKKLIKQM